MSKSKTLTPKCISAATPVYTDDVSRPFPSPHKKELAKLECIHYLHNQLLLLSNIHRRKFFNDICSAYLAAYFEKIFASVVTEFPRHTKSPDIEADITLSVVAKNKPNRLWQNRTQGY